MTYVKKIKSREFKIGHGPTARLRSFDIELTERCNNDCIHCCINLLANDRAAKINEMTTGQVKNTLTEAAAQGFLNVCFTGGEPLLRADFEDIYVFARRLGMKVLILTNACLITPKLADLLARIPPLESMEITVYGMHRESYEAVSRVPGSFAHFKRGADLLLERKIPFIVKSALLPSNKAEIEEFEKWANTIPWMNERPGYSMFFDLRRRCDDKKKNVLIKSLRLSPEEGVKVLTRGVDIEQYRKKMEEFAGKFLGPRGDALFRCGIGRNICIDAYGNIHPCIGLRAPEFTVNLFPGATQEKDSVPEIRETANTMNKVCNASIHSEKRKTIADAIASFKNLHEMKATNKEYLRRCSVCFLTGLCEQCPAKSWVENKTLDTPVEYFCEIAHAQARFLGWLRADEKAWEVHDWKKRVKGPQNKIGY